MATPSETAIARKRSKWATTRDLLPTLVLSLALVNFAAAVVRLTRACSDLPCDIASGAAGVVIWGVTAGLTALGVAVAVRRWRGSGSVSRSLLLVIATVAVLAATPTETAWFAGCNAHNAWASFAGGIAAGVADTSEPRLTFTHGQTLQGCL